MRFVGSANSGVASRRGDDDLVALYLAHYDLLVRTAAMLLGDFGAGEEVAQEAFVRVFLVRSAKPDAEYRLAYLRMTAINLARSRLRHRQLSHRQLSQRPTESAAVHVPSAEAAAMAGDAKLALRQALRVLPDRQREAIVLRYYAELSEAETAAAMSISPGAVKTHVHRGMAALARQLEDHK